MSRLTLLSSEMPDLLPMVDRSPGIHITDIINDIAVRLGHYKPSPLNMARLQLGQAFEWAIIERLRRHDPQRYVRIPEQQKDGVFVTLDALDRHLWAPIEVKATWKSVLNTAAEIESSTAYWNRRTQLCAQAAVMRSETGILPVLSINGNNRDDRAPAYREWQEEWSRREVQGNWDKLLAHRDEMVRLSSRWKRIALGEDRTMIDMEENNL